MEVDSEPAQTVSPPESIVMEKARIAMQLKLEGNGERIFYFAIFTECSRKYFSISSWTEFLNSDLLNRNFW